MCCTAHQRRTSAGECPPHAQHGDFSIQQLCHPSDTDELDLCTHNSIGNRLRLQLTCCVEFDCQRRVLSTFVAHTNHMSTDPLVHYSCRGGRLLILMPACRLPATNRKLLWARRKRTPVPCIQCCQPMPLAGKAAALRQCCCCYPSATAAAAKLLLLCATRGAHQPKVLPCLCAASCTAQSAPWDLQATQAAGVAHVRAQPVRSKPLLHTEGVDITCSEAYANAQLHRAGW
jgi:hypothetical protein